MKIDNKIYNNLFPSFNYQYSTSQVILSIVAIITLSLLVKEIFLKKDIVMNWCNPHIKMNPKFKNLTFLVRERLMTDEAKVKEIKEKQSKQLAEFEAWSANNQWQLIHRAHYDWWMFPVERGSSAYGNKYAIGQGEVEAFKADAEFMKNYKRGIELVVKAWGWDLEKEEAITDSEKTSDQKWTGYGVRLAKMSDSLHLFGEKKLHRKLQIFFKQYCLSQEKEVPISDLPWLKKTLGS